MNVNPLVSIFTATYNRRNELANVYQCLCNQTFKQFEWIIVDDGSSDDTKSEVEQWIAEGILDIRYFYQLNNGKHIAMNKAIEEARGEYFVNIDSDDIMRSNALEVFLNAWNEIPPNRKKEFVGVKAKCYDPDTGEAIGKPIANGKFESTVLDAKYKHGFNFEMWSMVRTEVRRKYLNPDIRGGKESGLRFYPEGIWQDQASKEYKTLFINEAIRGYSQNTSTSLMGRGAKYNRSKENIFLWLHVVNHNFQYIWYDPFSILKAVVGVSMDSFFLARPIKDTLKSVQGAIRKLLVLLFVPIGYACYLKKK